MQLYVAAKFEEREYARDLMDALEFANHTITYDWTEGTEFTTEQAILDMNGVMEAEALVFLAKKKYNYAGALVEFGIAVARNIPIYIIGDAIDNCIFVTLPNVRRGIEELL